MLLHDFGGYLFVAYLGKPGGHLQGLAGLRGLPRIRQAYFDSNS